MKLLTLLFLAATLTSCAMTPQQQNQLAYAARAWNQNAQQDKMIDAMRQQTPTAAPMIQRAPTCDGYCQQQKTMLQYQMLQQMSQGY